MRQRAGTEQETNGNVRKRTLFPVPVVAPYSSIYEIPLAGFQALTSLLGHPSQTRTPPSAIILLDTASQSYWISSLSVFPHLDAFAHPTKVEQLQGSSLGSQFVTAYLSLLHLNTQTKEFPTNEIDGCQC